MSACRLFVTVLMFLNTALSAQSYHQGFLTFSPLVPAESWVCPGVSSPGPGISLNPVDFGPLGDNMCGKCIRIVTPRQYSGTYPVVNVCPECMEGDIDLCDIKGTGRYDLTWKYVVC